MTQVLPKLPKTDLSLTKQLIQKRKEKENLLVDLKQQEKFHQSQVEGLEKQIEQVENLYEALEENRDYEYKVEIIEHVKDYNLPGRFTAFCRECEVTCHNDCTYEHDHEKIECFAMDSDGNCRKCPNRCVWSNHTNVPYIVKIEKTLKTLTNEEAK